MAIKRSLSTVRPHSVRRLSDQQLAAKLDQLNTQKHVLDAELLLCLSELERRGLYRERACSSLFEFCVTRLGQSEDVAYKRVGAARLMLAYPEIYELLANGRIHLSGLMLIKPHLTAANYRDWLSAACGKSKRQIEKLIATRLPRPDVPTTMRKLPERKAQPAVEDDPRGEPNRGASLLPSLDRLSPAVLNQTSTDVFASMAVSDETHAQGVDVGVTQSSGVAQSTTQPSSVAPSGSTGQSSLAQSSDVVTQPGNALTSGAVTQPGSALSSTIGPRPAPTVEPNVKAVSRVAPLSSQSYRVTFTASESLKQKLDRACELLSHTIAPNDLPAIIERALDQLIEREERRRYGGQKQHKNAPHSQSDSDVAKPMTNQSAPTVGAPRGSPSPSSDSWHAMPPRDEARRPPSPSGDSRHAMPPRDEARRPPSPSGDSRHAMPPRDDSLEGMRGDDSLEAMGGDDVPKVALRKRDEPLCQTEPEVPPRQTSEYEAHEPEVHASCQEHSMHPTKPQDPDPTLETTTRRSRYVPAAVRREVWARDGGQCTFVDHTGRRCEQRHFLELDHREAFAIGGSDTVENLRVRCHAHNAVEAEKLFGRDRIKRAIAHARNKRVG